MTRLILIAAVMLIVGCVAEPTPPAAPPEETTPETSAPEAPTTESAARADALLEDMRRREAAYRALERTLPREPTPAEILQRVQQQQPTAPIAISPVADTPRQQTAPAIATPARDESWWKNEMRILRVKLEEDQRLLAAALRQMDSSRLQITYDKATAEYNDRRAAVASDLAAIVRLEEDARRANVPPGWLRQ